MLLGCAVTIAISVYTFFFVKSLTDGTPLEYHVWIQIVMAVLALAFSGNVWGILVAIKQKKALGNLKDGELCGFSGRVSAKQRPLEAPFSKKPSVFVEYEALKSVGTQSSRRTIGYKGLMMVPSILSSMKGTVTLKGFPFMSQIPKDVIPGAHDRAKEFLSTVQFNEGNPINAIQRALDQEIPEFHTKLGDPELDESFQLIESIIPQGAEVTVFGKFDSQTNTLDIGAGLSDVNNSIQLGKGEDVTRRAVRNSILFTLFFGALLSIGFIIVYELLGVDVLSPYCVECKEIIKEYLGEILH